MRHRKLISISSAFALVTTLGMQGASALVWTDQADYAPGSVVTIHGDNSDGASYVDGESVVVSVVGPNDYTAQCTDDEVVDGAWSCDITLWDSLLAVGAYTYTAVGQTSGVVEYGEFTDAPPVPVNVTFAITAASLASGTLSLPIVMTYKPITGADTMETHTVSNSSSYTLGSKPGTPGHDNVVTYSGFSDSVVVGSQTCTRNVGQAASGTINVATTDTGLTVAYTCVTTPTDTTAPVISYTLSGTAGSNGWYTSNVFVDWTVTDAQSAVVIDSGCVDETLTAETAGTTPTCFAHSLGGSASNSVTVKIDKTGPSAALAVTAGTSGSNGWYTSDVTVSTTGTDSISGPVICSADQYLTTDSSGTTFNGSCTNDAGLTTDASALDVKLDKTGPSASLSVTAGTVGANGWYTSDVTVHTTGSDPNSDVTCTVDQQQTTETTGTEFNGSCTNDAGITTPAAPLTIKLDKTGPSALLAVTAGTSGSNGWYTSDVTVSTSGSDSMSDVTCTADQDLTTETTGLEFNGSCTNEAGLSTDATALTVKLDKTGPSANLSVTAGTLGNNGWYTSDVTVSADGSDSISGPVTCSADQFQTTETTDTLFYGTCTNDAGLTSNATAIHVKLDKMAPSALLTPTGTSGTSPWFTDDVTITTSGTDAISDIDFCTAPQSQTAETAGTVFNGSCTDMAGNVGTAASITVQLDKTGPVITWSSALPADGGSYYYGDLPATLTCTAVDAISDVTAAGCVVSGYNTDTGTYTVVAKAKNFAGITTTETRTYTVMPWTLRGFYAPVDMRFVWNVVKAGSTVPLKFEVFKGATELTSKGQIVQGPTDGFTVTKDPVGAPPTVTMAAMNVAMLTSGKTQLRYDATAGQFIQNWQTPKTPGYYKVTLTTKDGSTLVAYFQLK